MDAPLDDANVQRFCALLDELTKITQTKFIIIKIKLIFSREKVVQIVHSTKKGEKVEEFYLHFFKFYTYHFFFQILHLPFLAWCVR